MKRIPAMMKKINFNELLDTLDGKGDVWVYEDGTIITETPNSRPPLEHKQPILILEASNYDVEDWEEDMMGFKEHIQDKIEQYI